MQYRESNFEIRKQYKLRFRGAARQMAPFRQLRASGTKLQAKTAVANRRRAARGPNLGNIVTHNVKPSLLKVVARQSN